MFSGQNLLGSIDDSLQTLRQQVQQADKQIAEVSDELAALGRQQSENFRGLAKVRLDSVVSGELEVELQSLEKRVGDILKNRSYEIERMGRQLEETELHREQLEVLRTSAADRVDEAARTLDEQEARTQQHLQTVEAYRNQLMQTKQADRIAQHAEEKYQEALQNRLEKGKPYEDDTLFSYLWERSYGTSDYSAGALVRYLDRWVAGLCDYHRARPNYAMLLDIPVRLEAHAVQVRAAADTEFEQLRALEEEAAEEDGIPRLVQILDQYEAKLLKADSDIESLSQKLSDQMQQRAVYASGEDELFKQATSLLSQTLERENLNALYHQARATGGLEDDRLVNKLSENDRRIKLMQHTVDDYRNNHEKQLTKLAELEKVRTQYKRERFDDIYSGFDNKALLLMLLNQFLQGVSESGDLWDTIRREQKYRKRGSNPDFGSGGFGRNGSTWRKPSSGSWGKSSGGSWGGGLGGRGGSGGSRGGGFRTGGGF